MPSTGFFAHLVFWASAVMRWLIIALLVSVAGLLVAATGMVCHILRQRSKLKHPLPESAAAGIGTAEASDLESES